MPDPRTPIAARTAQSPRAETKYFKPKSLTWWSSVSPLLIGLIMATEPLHGQTQLVEALRNLTGGASATVLVNAGLAGIGLRGALA